MEKHLFPCACSCCFFLVLMLPLREGLLCCCWCCYCRGCCWRCPVVFCSSCSNHSPVIRHESPNKEQLFPSSLWGNRRKLSAVVAEMQNQPVPLLTRGAAACAATANNAVGAAHAAATFLCGAAVTARFCGMLRGQEQLHPTTLLFLYYRVLSRTSPPAAVRALASGCAARYTA